MLLRLATLTLILAACGADPTGPDLNETGAGCEARTIVAGPPDTLNPAVKQYYPQVTLVLSFCPAK